MLDWVQARFQLNHLNAVVFRRPLIIEQTVVDATPRALIESVFQTPDPLVWFIGEPQVIERKMEVWAWPPTSPKNGSMITIDIPGEEASRLMMWLRVEVDEVSGKRKFSEEGGSFSYLDYRLHDSNNALHSRRW